MPATGTRARGYVGIAVGVLCLLLAAAAAGFVLVELWNGRVEGFLTLPAFGALVLFAFGGLLVTFGNNQLRLVRGETPDWLRPGPGDDFRRGIIAARRPVWKISTAPIAGVLVGLGAWIAIRDARLAALGSAAALALGFTVGAVELTRYRKFRSPRLITDRLPVEIGQRFTGHIEVPLSVVPEDGFLVTLSCIRVTRRSSRMKETWLWEEELEISCEEAERRMNALAVPFEFETDADCAPSDESNPNSRIYWAVTIEAATSALDFVATFDVPFVAPAPMAEPSRATSQVISIAER